VPSTTWKQYRGHSNRIPAETGALLEKTYSEKGMAAFKRQAFRGVRPRFQVRLCWPPFVGALAVDRRRNCIPSSTSFGGGHQRRQAHVDAHHEESISIGSRN